MRRPLTDDEIQLLVDFARAHITVAEQFTGPVHGPYMGGDPRNLEHNPQDATPEEIERHKQACAAREPGEQHFATGFDLGGTQDKANDQRSQRLRRLLDEFGHDSELK
jgi:hypothetical protein